MPRRNRYPLTAIAHHVVQRGNNRQQVFFLDDDYDFYLECLADASERHRCQIHAYVLMPNHVHLLVTPEMPLAIGRMMQSIGRRYVRHVNLRDKRSGTLWEGRYRAGLVAGGAHLLRCQQYIETNPVRSLLVQQPAEYEWSSHAQYARGRFLEPLSPSPSYLELGPDSATRSQIYCDLLQKKPLDQATLAEIRGSLDGSRLYGPRQFEKELEAQLQRRIGPGKRGRPRKVVKTAVEAA